MGNARRDDGCPTDEYGKLASMEVIGAGDSIRVRLEAKPGEKLDAAQVETCLLHDDEASVEALREYPHTPGGILG